jgi:hypothetical protein
VVRISPFTYEGGEPREERRGRGVPSRAYDFELLSCHLDDGKLVQMSGGGAGVLGNYRAERRRISLCEQEWVSKPPCTAQRHPTRAAEQAEAAPQAQPGREAPHKHQAGRSGEAPPPAARPAAPPSPLRSRGPPASSVPVLTALPVVLALMLHSSATSPMLG